MDDSRLGPSAKINPSPPRSMAAHSAPNVNFISAK